MDAYWYTVRKEAVYNFKTIFTGNEEEYTVNTGEARGWQGLEGTHKSDIGELKKQEDSQMSWQRMAKMTLKN